jgi:hypothetical protein
VSTAATNPKAAATLTPLAATRNVFSANRSTLMFAVSSSRHKNALLARERFRMAATEQGRRHNHQNDG